MGGLPVELMKYAVARVAEVTPNLTYERRLVMGAEFVWRDKGAMSSDVSGRVRAQEAREIANEADKPMPAWIKPDSSLARQATVKQTHFKQLLLKQEAHAVLIENDVAVRRHLMASLDLAKVLDDAYVRRLT